MRRFLFLLPFLWVSGAWGQGCPSTPGACPNGVLGSLLVGAATGGAQGPGTVNATGIYVNGVPIGSGGGNVVTTGTPANGNLTKFSGVASITNADLSGDVTTSGSLVTIVGNLSGVTNGSLANSGLAHPSMTVNGTTCTLGSSCSPPGTGSVTSVATSGGLTGGTITTTGTISCIDAASTTKGCPTPDGTSTHFLNGAGGWTTPPGGSSGANPTAAAGPNAVNGSASTFMRSDGAPAVQLGTAAQRGIVQVDGTTITALSGVISAAAAANPTGTAGPAAVNGTAATFMRSDGAPAVQKGSASQFGIVEADGSSITASAGVISGAAGANPSATAGPSAVNGSAVTFMRSDGAPAIQKATSGQFGIVEVDGTTITASAGVITSHASATSVTPGTTTVIGAPAPCVIDNATGTTMGCGALGTNLLLSAGTLSVTAPVEAAQTSSFSVASGDMGETTPINITAGGTITLPSSGAFSTVFGAGQTWCAQNIISTNANTITNSTGGTMYPSVATLPANWGICIGSDGAALYAMQFPDKPAATNLAQTWTAAQTFTDGDLLLKGSSSGQMTLHAPAAASTYGATFPANTGTVAELNAVNVWSNRQDSSSTSLSISIVTFTPDGSNNTYAFTLVHASCPCTVANPSAETANVTAFDLVITQSATGSDTIGTWGTSYKFPGGTPPTLSTAANAIDVVTCKTVIISSVATNLCNLAGAAYQ